MTDALHVVSYIEVQPGSERMAATLLGQYRDAARGARGNMRVEVLQQRGRPDHFAVLEVWADQQVLEAQSRAQATQQIDEALRKLVVSPYDERPHRGLAVTEAPRSAPAGAIHVVTHADAIPPSKDDAAALLTRLAEASRSEDGNLRSDVLQQASRPNHFTLVEVWRDDDGRVAHVAAAHTRRFREQFQPMSGSLYDERLYVALD